MLIDGNLSPMQADVTNNATSPTHSPAMTSSNNRVPSPSVTSLPPTEAPPVKEYQHHKKAMISSSTCSTPRSKSASPVTIMTSQTPFTPSDNGVTSPDSGMSSASSSPETPDVSIDDNNNNTNVPSNVPLSNTGTPLAPPGGQPFKRRPGRPPGSTKKFKNPYTREYRRKSDSDSSNDFSLRKFFEAGGRDYNEYLEWLKKRGHSQNNGMTPQTTPTQPQYTNLPTSIAQSPNVAPSYPVRSPMYPSPPLPHQGRPSGPQSPQPPAPQVLPQPPPHILPPGYRPILIPRTPLPPGVRPGEMLPFMPGFTMVPLPGQTIPSQKSPNSATKDSFLALDLSAKKRRSDSDLPNFEASKVHRDEIHSHHMHTKAEEYSREIRNQAAQEEPSSPTKSLIAEGVEVESSTPEVDISTWDVENVVKFVTSVPGCHEYAETFREHKIDGATLPHLSESHLLNFVKMKLGPAIRLRLAISRLKIIS